MSRLVLVPLVLGVVACSDRSLPDQRSGSISLVAAAAQESIHTGVSSGTSFVVTLEAVNWQADAPLQVGLTRGQVRSVTGPILAGDTPIEDAPTMTVPAGQSQRLAFGVTWTGLQTCPRACDAAGPQMREDQFVLDAVFTLDGEEVPLSAPTDLYCTCQP